ncbi:MAG: ribosome biogenesis GTP-binding protein YihA/YsxC [Gemmatimonadota bacterium]
MSIRNVAFVGAIGRSGQRPPGSLDQVAFAGRSNVGKSSLINALVGRKAIARVSGRPGRTQEINFYEVDGRFLLADLPGYGFAEAPVGVRERWEALVREYLSGESRLVGVVLLLDCRRGVTPRDRDMLDILGDTEVPTLFVLTKIDKLNRSRRAAALRDVRAELGVPADQVLGTSARTKDGLSELEESVFALVDAPQTEEET